MVPAADHISGDTISNNLCLRGIGHQTKCQGKKIVRLSVPAVSLSNVVPSSTIEELIIEGSLNCRGLIRE
jgi:hypothetical protein